MLKNVFLILTCNDTIYKKGWVRFYTLGSLFPRSLKCTVLDKPPVDYGGVSRGRSVAVAVGYLLLALRWHFNDTYISLEEKKNKEKKWYLLFHPHWLNQPYLPGQSWR